MIRFDRQAAATQALKSAHTPAMDELLDEAQAGAGIAQPHGQQQLGLKIGARRHGRGGSGSGLGHGGSGEFAIQQGTDRQEKTNRQRRQDPETGGSAEIAVGSVQHHIGEVERPAIGGTDGFNREGKGIQRR